MGIGIKDCHLPKHHCAACHDSREVPDVHKKEAHACIDPPCEITSPHGHIEPDHSHDSCLTCVRDHLRKIFPLQEKIVKSNFNPLTKQLLVTGGFLSTSLPVAKIAEGFLGFFDISPFISSLLSTPLTISSMHFSNRGTKNPDKWGLLLGSSLSLLSLQKITNMPRVLLRSTMALAVFLIERFRPDKVSHQNEHNQKLNTTTPITKKDFVSFGKVQSLILTVPTLMDSFTHKLGEINNQKDSLINRFLGNIGISAFQIAGLTLGFVGLGKAIDAGVHKLGLTLDDNHSSGKTEAVADVCAHCGVPGCIDSVTESITEASESSIVQSLAA